MATHPDLQAEQAYIDLAYDRLDAMRRVAEDLRDSVIGLGKGGTPQSRVERDVFVQTSLQRLEQLQLGRASLVFGRLDHDAPNPDGAGDGDGDDDGDGYERFYIGRLAVSDEHQEPLVVDWRAPIAEAFYRATGRSPMGLRRRRHFATDGRKLLAIEDELFRSDAPAGSGDDDELELVGPGALLAALSRSRSGQMRDIVATVQREQDEIIRAELPGVLVVQGGPGTGKTAVALHRAAYLLYTHRFPLEQQGVLVVGPNQVFLRYIEQVLPSLGESGVALTTIPGLMPSIRPRLTDGRVAARVKGDRRMAAVLAQAVLDRERPLRNDLLVGFGSLQLRLLAAGTRSVVRAVRRRPGLHNPRRRQVETLVLRALYDDYVAAVERGRRAGIMAGVLGPDGAELEFDDFASQLRREPAVTAALDRMWPVLAPEDLLNDLFGAPALLALAARHVLAPEERDALLRPRAHTREDAVWSAADIPLLDEARALLGPVKPRGDDEPRGYGHIVVDEAQDLSPMAVRMLARRSVSGSVTLVGDIGQATSAFAPDDWSEVMEAFLSGASGASRRAPRVAPLTVNYRTPAEIMEVAAAVLEAAAVPGVDPPRSVRATGRAPVQVTVSPEDLPSEVANVAAGEVAAGGTVAVIVPALLLDDLSEAFDLAGLPWGTPERSGLSAPVTLLDVAAAKGLEFDSVVVVEPAVIVEESDQGLRALFVALTRTTRRLVTVHASPLPAALADGYARVLASGGERSFDQQPEVAGRVEASGRRPR